ncbi:DUF2793 domain-containing protein [Bosea minatitlanensis]|jgi:hypothetical protein|uniref:DUF2793 domain-containing protein n=1 Tax=Bosea minatitlanensis TaxID=128782 RepID=A0ABW0F7Y5_9HYPH|nr:DUF2793 domain-containing protein [Bosea minatitlanensis]MCT4494483.1 DUF2793 domain-containing protein [Bosea minatitlanensis]
MPTTNLGLPQLAADQAQKHVTVNEGLALLDALVMPAVKTRSLSAPPASPNEGERWIIGASPTGLWASKAGQIAVWLSGAWTFLIPNAGWTIHVEDERLTLTWSDGAWRDRIVGTPNGGATRLVALEQELTLSGAYIDATTVVIADRMIVLAVASRTTQAITGATSYSVGVAGNTSQFGGSLGIALGSTNIGVIGPTAFYADTPVRVTAAGGNFTGGKVRLVLYALAFTAPNA